jgi:hypothetical protein
MADASPLLTDLKIKPNDLELLACVENGAPLPAYERHELATLQARMGEILEAWEAADRV